MLNAVYRCATDRSPKEFAAVYPEARDPAAAAMRDILGMLVGLRVDYHALVDMAGFVRLVDALGGVNVHVARPVQIRLSPPDDSTGWRTFDIPVGEQHLHGEEALAFVRSRAGSGDVDRMRRQRCLLSAVTARTEPATLIRRFPEIARTVEEALSTNIPMSLLADLIEVLDRVDVDELVTLGLTQPHYQRFDRSPNVERIHERVQEVLDDPVAAAAAAPTAEGAEEVCR
jgi:polyisoprenyl-teichoic acid--peptidoglycan teichoic acid transferase